MTYRAALDALVAASTAADVPVDLENADIDPAMLRAIFGDELAGAIAASGYPGGAELPWTVEDLYFYPLAELAQHQAGYRQDAVTGEPSPDWGEDRHAIGDWAGNPVSIAGDRGIDYARHGQGHWTHHRIAADLPEFLAMLAAWLGYFVVEREGSVFDDNFEITQETRDEVQRVVLARRDPATRAAATGFLLGEL
jgi:hypothetical protein